MKRTIWPGIYSRDMSGRTVFDAVATVGRRQKWSRGHLNPKDAIFAKESMRLLMKPDASPLVPTRMHGFSRTGTYKAWANMIQRCTNERHPFYADYGARGIAVCARWGKFENFLHDVGVRPRGLTLDRIDNDGDYEPGNCRWATWSEQRQNRRDSSLRLALT